MTIHKFKIGDRVKWRDEEGRARIGVIYNRLDHPVRYSMDSDRCLYWHESHLSLAVPETPKFKVGDRVKWAHFGKPSFGFVRARLPDGWWEVEYKTGCMTNFHESSMSLDVPEPSANSGLSNKLTELAIALVNSNLSLAHRAEAMDAIRNPKQFATKLEAELGAEIVRLNYQIIDQGKANALIVSMMTAEIGNGHRERFAKEAAQRELADAKDMISRLKTFIGLP